MSDVATNLMLTGLLLLFSTIPLVLAGLNFAGAGKK